MKLENKEQIMQIMYEEAQNMLKEICPKKINLERYFNLEKSFQTKNDILSILLICLQDKQMSDKVIGITRPERKDIFRKLLFDYDCDMILNTYNEESLLQAFSKNFTINNIDSKQNLWRLYTKSVLSSASFLNNFPTAKDFDSFVMGYQNNPLALLHLLQDKIFGMGFALACHFLKELGYPDYAKPDLHIKEIFVSLGLCIDNDSAVFETILEMSNVVHDTPYNIDKLFWLVCSGNFHLDHIMVERNKDNLIKRIRTVLDTLAKKEDLNTDLEIIGVTKCSKFHNNYKYDYARITLNDKIVTTFFAGEDKDKKSIDVMIKYNKEKDILVIEKIKN